MHRVALSLLAIISFPVAAHGQANRRLESRAAFAALDSTALADSSAMLPLDTHDRVDSVMLDIWTTLDEAGVRTLGLQRSRIRKWNGFGSQAHPAAGILIDSEELKALLDSTRRYKGMAGVSRAEIANRILWAPRFVVAHEYAHLIQYKFFGRDSVEAPAATRVIECGADILGGYLYEIYLAWVVPNDSVLKVARDVGRDFGYVIGANDWLDRTTHPLPEDRRRCIGLGMEASLGMGLLARARVGEVDSLNNPVIRWLEDNEPNLRSGRESATEWSRTRARQLVATASATLGSKEFAVVIDTSVAHVVLHLATAASKGPSEMRKLRGPQLLAGKGTYVLREALTAPWRCSIETSQQFEEAECSYQLRLQPDELNALSQELIAKVAEALTSTGWQEAQSTIEAGDAPKAPRKNLRRVFFTRGGADPDNPEVARVDVFLGDSLLNSTAQLPPGYVVGFSVRAKR